MEPVRPEAPTRTAPTRTAPARTVAVVGSGTPVGRAVLARLAAPDGPDRVIAVDGSPASMPHPRAELRVMDHRDRLLPLAVEGVDVLVHCAFDDDVAADPDALYGANVGGTRNVLQAASKAGVDHLVVLSSAMAYGAHEDNPLPLDEAAPLRANPGFAYGYQRQLVEELVADWAGAHPAAAVTVLRTAPVLGGGVATATARRLQAPRIPVPAGQSAPWQVVHVDDVAAAVRLAVDRRLAGTYNVACDGWLSDAEVAAAVGRPLVHVGQSVAAELLRRAGALGLAPAPPEVMPYLLHPWVLDTAALRAHGWRATRSNAEVLREHARDSADVVAIGRAAIPRSALRRAAATALGGVALAALAVRRAVRRRRAA